MRAVNLLPKDDPRTRRRGLPNPWVLLSVAAPLVAGGGVYFAYSSEHSSVASRSAQLAAVQSRLAALTPAVSNAAAESGLLSQRASREAALQDAVAKGMPWDVTLDDLARVLPKQVWLTSLSAQSPTPASVATPTGAASSSGGPAGFTLQGFAHSQTEVADLLARLSLLPMLNNVSLASTSTSQPTGATGPSTVQFEVTAGLQQPLGSPAP
jgi:Tfp pilus assembly protein PilN